MLPYGSRQTCPSSFTDPSKHAFGNVKVVDLTRKKLHAATRSQLVPGEPALRSRPVEAKKEVDEQGRGRKVRTDERRRENILRDEEVRHHRAAIVKREVPLSGLKRDELSERSSRGGACTCRWLGEQDGARRSRHCRAQRTWSLPAADGGAAVEAEAQALQPALAHGLAHLLQPRLRSKNTKSRYARVR
eukprot:4778040-Pleurochrysis_carterae.AAC.1